MCQFLEYICKIMWIDFNVYVVAYTDMFELLLTHV